MTAKAEGPRRDNTTRRLVFLLGSLGFNAPFLGPRDQHRRVISLRLGLFAHGDR